MNSLKILLLIVLCHTATSFLANGVSFRNIGSLGMMKNRFGQNFGSTSMHIDYDTLTISEMDESMGDNINDTTADMLNGLSMLQS